MKPPRVCPDCGAALDPGEKCDCMDIYKKESGIRNQCSWCGSSICGMETILMVNDKREKLCFRCRLALNNLRSQREELRKISW